MNRTLEKVAVAAIVLGSLYLIARELLTLHHKLRWQVERMLTAERHEKVKQETIAIEEARKPRGPVGLNPHSPTA